MQSDLEEGEIPEFEVQPSSHKRRLLVRPERVKTLLDARHGHEKEAMRYDSPPSEGEYISEEEKLVKRNRISHKDLYKSHLMGKAPKNFRSVQPTYGSVEDIMTKIGESLGRRSNYYYNKRGSKEPRYLITINDSRDINPVLRETSPVMKRSNYNYYKRRYGEPYSQSVNMLRGKYGRIRYEKLFDARRSGNDMATKRKREHSKINEGSSGKMTRCKKLRLLKEKEKEKREHEKKQKENDAKVRLFKEIPLPQVQEEKNAEKEGTNAEELPNTNNPNCPPDNPKDSVSPKVADSNSVDAPSTAVLNCETALNNATNKSEQLNEEDEDEDIELIKLRLLALTSNKKKSQNLTDNSVDEAKKLEIRTEENAMNDSNTKSPDFTSTKPDDFVDNEKTKENPSSENEETVKERRYDDNEIDRYELFLRAEALKTALLKKHQRILKKRKTLSANSRKNQETGGESSNGNKNARGNDLDLDLDLDIISDEELFGKNRDSDLNAQLEVTENCKKPEINNMSKLDSESDKEAKTVDIQQESGLNSENMVTAVNTDHSEKSSLPTESSTPESNKESVNAEINSQSDSTGEQSETKEAEKFKPQQIKKSTDLSETNIKENNVSCEKKDDSQETKSRSSPSLSNKNKMDPEKKQILRDEQHSSSIPEMNASAPVSKSQISLDKKKNIRNPITLKPTILSKEEPAAKIPENERIIVHLGSDSSDEECVPDCVPDTESHTVANVEPKDVNPLVSIDNQYDLKEFEKSVELLLSGARKKIESRKELISEIPSTPEAVYSHLAPSQRLEYIRLKQKIAEKEKLGKGGKNSVNSSSALDKSKTRNSSIEDKNLNQINIQRNIPKKPAVAHSSAGNNRSLIFKNQLAPKEVINPSDKNYFIRNSNYGLFRNNKNAQVNQFSNIKKPALGLGSQSAIAGTPKKDFTDFNSISTIRRVPSAIIIERKRMFNQNKLHLERLKILWKNIKVEKMMEAKYEREIKKLKAQQNFFELKINQQRLKIKKLAEESKEVYEAFQRNKKKVEALSRKRKSVIKTETEAKRSRVSVIDITENEEEKIEATGFATVGNEGEEYKVSVIKSTEDEENKTEVSDTMTSGIEGNKVEVSVIVSPKSDGNKIEILDISNEESDIGKSEDEDEESEEDNSEEDTSSEDENDVRLNAKDKVKRLDVGVNTEKVEVDQKGFGAMNTVAVPDKEPLEKYDSPLRSLNQTAEPVCPPVLDPNIILCPFDLIGRCNDEHCLYQHLRS